MENYMFASLANPQKVEFLNERTGLVNQLSAYYRNIKDKKLRQKATDKTNKKILFALQKYYNICNNVIISFNNTVVNIVNNELITIDTLKAKIANEIPEEFIITLNKLNAKIKKDINKILGVPENYELKEITEVNLKPEQYQYIYKVIAEKQIQNVYNKYLDEINNSFFKSVNEDGVILQKENDNE